MSDRIPICEEAELGPGDREIVTRNNVSIGVFNIEGEYYAILNNCPHQQGPLCEGEVSRQIEGEFMGLGKHVEEKYSDDYMVVCPLHNWAFDLEDGTHVGSEDVTVPTFDVVVEDGEVYLDL